MLQKPNRMTKRIPALVVPDEMHEKLMEISENEDLSLSEVIRQGLEFFLSEYVNKINNSVIENSNKELNR